MSTPNNNNFRSTDAYDEHSERMVAVWTPDHELNAPTNGSTPTTQAAAAASEDDNNSLSTEALLAEVAADDGSPGELELFHNNDELVAPNNRVGYMIMCAKVQGINTDEIYASVSTQPGMKSVFKPAKDDIIK